MKTKQTNLVLVALACLTIGLLASGWAGAAVYTFQEGVDGYIGTDDTLLQSNLSNQSAGGLATINLGIPIGSPRPTGNKHRSIIRFDVAALAGLEIQVASLTVTLSSIAGDTFTDLAFDLYRISDANKAWVGGNVFANPPGANGYATWSEIAETGSNTNPWAGSAGLFTAGTDYVAPTLATVVLSSADLSAGTQVTFTFSDYAFLEDWASDPTANAGFLLVATGIEADGGLTQSYLQFHSSNGTTAAFRPLLSVTAAAAPIPEPLSLGLLGLGSLLLGCRRRR